MTSLPERLTKTQLKTLAALAARGNATTQDIAGDLNLTPSAARKRLRTLESKGLVECSEFWGTYNNPGVKILEWTVEEEDLPTAIRGQLYAERTPAAEEAPKAKENTTQYSLDGKAWEVHKEEEARQADKAQGQEDLIAELAQEATANAPAEEDHQKRITFPARIVKALREGPATGMTAKEVSRATLIALTDVLGELADLEVAKRALRDGPLWFLLEDPRPTQPCDREGCDHEVPEGASHAPYCSGPCRRSHKVQEATLEEITSGPAEGYSFDQLLFRTCSSSEVLLAALQVLRDSHLVRVVRSKWAPALSQPSPVTMLQALENEANDPLSDYEEGQRPSSRLLARLTPKVLRARQLPRDEPLSPDDVLALREPLPAEGTPYAPDWALDEVYATGDLSYPLHVKGRNTCTGEAFSHRVHSLTWRYHFPEAPSQPPHGPNGPQGDANPAQDQNEPHSDSHEASGPTVLTNPYEGVCGTANLTPKEREALQALTALTTYEVKLLGQLRDLMRVVNAPWPASAGWHDLPHAHDTLAVAKAKGWAWRTSTTQAGYSEEGCRLAEALTLAESLKEETPGTVQACTQNDPTMTSAHRAYLGELAGEARSQVNEDCTTVGPHVHARRGISL